jgi:hypothetical protein
MDTSETAGSWFWDSRGCNYPLGGGGLFYNWQDIWIRRNCFSSRRGAFTNSREVSEGINRGGFWLRILCLGSREREK